MRNRKSPRRLVTACAVAALLAAACGAGEDGGEGAAAEEGTNAADEEGADDGSDGLDVDQVRLGLDGAHFMNVAPFSVAAERFWPDLGLTEEPYIAITSEVIAGLLGEDVWIGQIETQPLWAALSQGGADLKVVGVEKGFERWILGAAPGIEGPEDLVGQTVTGGPPGERNVTVMEAMLEEIGLSRDDVEFVTIEGGSDEYFRAMLAGQIVAAPLRDRHLTGLEDEGGTILFEDVVEAPQEVWTTTADVLEENPEAVSAFLQGTIAAKQWASEGPDMVENRDEAFEMTEADGYEAETGEYDAWEAFIESNWALSGGASSAAFDQWTEDMVALDIVEEGFDWRGHVDFEPLWQAQEALGIEQVPDPSEFEGG